MSLQYSTSGTSSPSAGPRPSPSSFAVTAAQDSQQHQLLDTVDKLKFFLATAPTTFPPSERSSSAPAHEDHRALNRFLLPTGDFVSCVLWNGLYHITGTDIVRALTFRFLAFGRPVRHVKKFEEGVFSDLRNLKSGIDATLEEPKSQFLELLFKHNCIRTQKKQKVFYWFSVPHDRLFLDALDRDLKREKLGQESTTVVEGEPASSFRWDPTKSLFDQFAATTRVGAIGVDDREARSIPRPDADPPAPPSADTRITALAGRAVGPFDPRLHTSLPLGSADAGVRIHPHPSEFVFPTKQTALPTAQEASYTRHAIEDLAPFGEAFTLVGGAPTYKQRSRPPIRRKVFTQTPDFDTRQFASPDQMPNGWDYPHDGKLWRCSAQDDTVGSPADELSSDQLRFGLSSATQDQSQGPVTTHASSPSLARRLHIEPGDDPDCALPPASFPFLRAGPDTSTETAAADEERSRLKTYVCPVSSCGRMFKRLEHLKRHVRTHTSEKPHVCSTCRKAFARSDNLAAHVKTHVKKVQSQTIAVDPSRSNDLASSTANPEDVALLSSDTPFNRQQHLPQSSEWRQATPERDRFPSSADTCIPSATETRPPHSAPPRNSVVGTSQMSTAQYVWPSDDLN